MSKPKKYVVILELPSGYMDCIGIYDDANAAYGAAYLALCDGMNEKEAKKRRITILEERDGQNGYVMELENEETGEITEWCTVLFYKPEEEKA